MEQVHLIALTILLHTSSDHTMSPSVTERGLNWDLLAAETAYSAAAAIPARTAAAACNPIEGGASTVHTGPAEGDDLDYVDCHLSPPGPTAPDSMEVAMHKTMQVTLFNPPRMVGLYALEAERLHRSVALETWAPAPPNWAPSWNTLLIPKLSHLTVDRYRVASGEYKCSLTWISTPCSGGLQLPSGASLRPDDRPVFHVRSLTEEPPFPPPFRRGAWSSLKDHAPQAR